MIRDSLALSCGTFARSDPMSDNDANPRPHRRDNTFINTVSRWHTRATFLRTFKVGRDRTRERQMTHLLHPSPQRYAAIPASFDSN